MMTAAGVHSQARTRGIGGNGKEHGDAPAYQEHTRGVGEVRVAGIDGKIGRRRAAGAVGVEDENVGNEAPRLDS